MKEFNRATKLADECLDDMYPHVKPLLRECYFRIGEFDGQLAFSLFVPNTEEHRDIGKNFCSGLLVILFCAFRTTYIFIASEGTVHWPCMYIKPEVRDEITQEACEFFRCSPKILSTVAGWYLCRIFEGALSQRHQRIMSADAIVGNFQALIDTTKENCQ